MGDNKHRVPVRVSDLRRESGRLSRIDKPSSHIPRPSSFARSVDRVSGVRPIDNQCSATRGMSRSIVPLYRRRSADSARRTLNPPRPRTDSVQRNAVRPSTFANRETPNCRTPNPGYSMFTPMSGVSSGNRRSNLQRTPSNERLKTALSVVEKVITNLYHPSKDIKDKRAVTDIDWQMRKGREVVEKLRQNPKLNNLLSNSGNPLRPISIRLFIELTNELLSEFGENRLRIDTNNYIDKLPQFALKLSYPGVMAKSWLKTVNAAHTYPHMLAFVSYLIDLVELKNRIQDDINFDILFGVNEERHFLTLRLQYYFDTWTLFQYTSLEDDQFTKLADEYIIKYKELRGISEDIEEKIESALNDARNEYSKLVNEESEFQQKENSVHSTYTSLKNRSLCLIEMNTDLKNKIESLEKKYNDDQSSCSHIINKNIELQNQATALQEQLNHQKMTIKVKDEIIQETDFINECLKSKTEFIKDMEKTSFKKDIELALEQKQALNISMTVNKCLVKVGLAAGRDLTAYSLVQRDLLIADTPTVIQNTIEELKLLKMDSELCLQKARQEKDTGISHKHQIQHDIQTLAGRMKVLEKEYIEMGQKNNVIKSNIGEIKNKQENLILKGKKIDETKQKNREIFEDCLSQLNHWRSQDLKWKNHLEKLRNVEKSMDKDCRKCAEELILEYIKIANNNIPILTQQKNI